MLQPWPTRGSVTTGKSSQTRKPICTVTVACKVMHHSVSCMGTLTSYPPKPQMAQEFLDRMTYSSRENTQREKQKLKILIAHSSPTFYLLWLRLALHRQRTPSLGYYTAGHWKASSRAWAVTAGHCFLPTAGREALETLSFCRIFNQRIQSLCSYQLLAACDNRLFFTLKEWGRFSQGDLLSYRGQHCLKS